ncbi:MAG: hypothetical protein IJ870_05290 [Alphaproteobacteria bacterium]|nr:hypothetical protein [Alphaproteobacteria bacterium]
MKNHPANAGGISVPSKLRLPIRLKVGLEFAFHRLTPVVCEFDVIKTLEKQLILKDVNGVFKIKIIAKSAFSLEILH